ncbi:MAG: putative hydrolase [Alphaproteobacteria bacterium]|nr:putative hydrolase [Alphaproteobacteria bacterium]
MSLSERLRRALDQSLAQSVKLIEADSRALLETGPTTPAAVLVAIVDRPEPTVILTLRTDTIRRHPGQVAFPGGRVDPDDENVIAAALREAEEEIGLPRGQVDVIGTADRYRTITGYEVTPVVGIVPPDLPLTAQPDEVAAIFEVPLRHLLEPQHQRMRTIERNGQEHFYYEIEWEDRRIWGATAGMIVNLSRRLAFVP